MSKWVLTCSECKTEFEHSQINDVSMALLDLPPKPEFPPSGNECACPHCGKSSVYLRTDLRYRA
jgi:hypothetical protein